MQRSLELRVLEKIGPVGLKGQVGGSNLPHFGLTFWMPEIALRFFFASTGGIAAVEKFSRVSASQGALFTASP
jgi:hypothetical protein